MLLSKTGPRQHDFKQTSFDWLNLIATYEETWKKLYAALHLTIKLEDFGYTYLYNYEITLKNIFSIEFK